MKINTLEEYKATQEEILEIVSSNNELSRRLSPTKVNRFITAKTNLELIVQEYGSEHAYSKEAVKIVVYRLQDLKDNLDDVKFRANARNIG